MEALVFDKDRFAKNDSWAVTTSQQIEIGKLKAELAAVRSDNTVLKLENERINEQSAQVQTRNSLLCTQVQKMRNRIRSLQARAERLSETIHDLRDVLIDNDIHEVMDEEETEGE